MESSSLIDVKTRTSFSYFLGLWLQVESSLVVFFILTFKEDSNLEHRSLRFSEERPENEALLSLSLIVYDCFLI